jgi:hypothetical protein
MSHAQRIDQAIQDAEASGDAVAIQVARDSKKKFLIDNIKAGLNVDPAEADALGITAEDVLAPAVSKGATVYQQDMGIGGAGAGAGPEITTSRCWKHNTSPLSSIWSMIRAVCSTKPSKAVIRTASLMRRSRMARI